MLLAPMAATGAEPIGSMGTDTPVAVLSRAAAAAVRLLQPAVRPGDQPAAGRDPRGAGDLAGRARSARSANLLTPGAGVVPADRAAVPGASTTTSWPRSCTSTTTATCPASPSHVVAGCTAVDGGGDGAGRPRSSGSAPRCRSAIERRRADHRAAPTATATPSIAPIPSLLLTAAVHHHLVRERPRTKVGLVVETGDVPRGAPRRAADRVRRRPRSTRTWRWSRSRTWSPPAAAPRRRPGEGGPQPVKALGKGVLKVMSKMGISTVASYTGAQVFEAVGLAQQVVDEYFTGTTSRLGGVGLDVLAEEVAARHATAYPPTRAAPAHRAPRRRRGVPVAPRGRAAPVQPRDGVPAAARDPAPALRRVQQYTEQGRRASRERLATLRGLFAAAPATRGRRSRSTRSSRSSTIVQAVLHRRDVVRVDLGRGARDARDRDEPARRPVQHRRGRRGRRRALRDADCGARAVKQVASAGSG